MRIMFWDDNIMPACTLCKHAILHLYLKQTTHYSQHCIIGIIERKKNIKEKLRDSREEEACMINICKTEIIKKLTFLKRNCPKKGNMTLTLHNF